MSKLVILKWRSFDYKAKIEKKDLFYLGPKYVVLTYFLKDYTKKVLRAYKSIEIENFKLEPLCPIMEL